MPKNDVPDINRLPNLSKRQFLQSSAGVAACAVGLSACSADSASPISAVSSRNSDNASQRALNAADIKKNLASEQYFETLALPPQEHNNDEQRYADAGHYASFFKTLPQNNFGEVDRAAFTALQQAMHSGSGADMSAIPLDTSAQRKLTNPQGAFRYDAAGLDSHATRMPPAPSFRSAIAAAEMGEVYWQALSRDVPFIDYDSNATIALAVADLNNFSSTVGPKTNGLVTNQNLFRGETAGDVIGPYISQFLLQDVPYGSGTITQRYNVGLANTNFMTSTAHWLNVQRGGAAQETLAFDPSQRYIFNNRALSEYVHNDVLFQAYFNAALILLSLGDDVQSADNPYRGSSNQDGFTSLGAPWLLQLLTHASNLALSGAWYQKWRMHRRLRPEVYAGRVHFHDHGDRNYEIHPDILNSDGVNRVKTQYGTAFLPMAFTEGSPTHPSYPAGHAAIAGACCTILKAFFNEDFILPNTVQADATGSQLLPYSASALTVGNEINKLANNISLGRDAAGVHYRSDGVEGLLVGEQQAIRLLKDYVYMLNEDALMLSFTRFNGETFTITKP